jgi:hypothetical protein
MPVGFSIVHPKLVRWHLTVNLPIYSLAGLGLGEAPDDTLCPLIAFMPMSIELKTKG